MATESLSSVLCTANPEGSSEALAAVLEAVPAEQAQAVAVIGNLSAGQGAESDLGLFRTLAGDGRPAYWVPGPEDAPVQDYLRGAHGIEVVAPALHGVHGTAAFGPGGHVVFAGFGGEVVDDPEGQREEVARLSYPAWEAEYRLKLLRELDEHQFALLFFTPPAHKGLGEAGSEVLAELVNTHRPRIVVCGGEQRSEILGRSLVVSPGSLGDGHYAIADLNAREARLAQLSASRIGA